MRNIAPLRRETGVNPWIALTVLNLGLFMVSLDVTIVNVAIPQLADGINASLDQAAWVTNAYVLALAVLLVTTGRLGDIFGPKPVFLAGTAVFTTASAVCGMVDTPSALIGARALQGVGAALLTPQPLTIVTGLFPPERRGSAFAVNGIVGGLGTLAGPLAGGLLVTHLSWRWVFYANVPVGALAIAATLYLVPDLRTGRRHRLDVKGVTLASVGLLAVTFGITEGQRYAWGRVWSFVTIPLILLLGALLLAVFGWQQARTQRREPLLLFTLFRDRDFALMIGVGLGLQFVFIGYLLPFAIYLQSVLGMSPLQAGLVTAPSAVANIVASPVLGRIVDRRGARGVLICGLLAFATGIAMLIGNAGVGQSRWAFIPAMLVIGLGISATFSPMITKAMAAIPQQHAGAASGMLNTSRQLGAVLGGGLIAAVLQNRLASALRDQAVARTAGLPAGVRAELVAAFTGASRGGLQIGAGQSGAKLPALPASLAAEARRLSGQVYQHAYVAALFPTLLLCVGVLAVTVLCALAAHRDRLPAEQGIEATQLS
ncbi:MAG: DHA2 family efflux MFS transporter permease subunit [Streptomycetaceae bacterium]|nr:DHA2 family efflux MFS transporter permease subunit [Streptomycetaceae bacterium]